MSKIRFIIATLFLSITVSTYSATIAQGKQLFLAGKYSQALPILMNNYKKSSGNANLNYCIGVCLYEQGEYARATKYLKIATDKKEIDAPYYMALANYKLGYYTEAGDNISTYESLLDNKGKTVPQEYQESIASIKLINRMYDHVEKIEVIDSIIVDKEKFFEFFKISPEIGELSGIDALDPVDVNEPLAPVYMPESGDKMFWSDKNDDGHYTLLQSTKLFDNTWDVPVTISDNITTGVDAAYPFLMPDGTTLYFAAKGTESIGGYDIFVSSKDMESGEFRMAQNIGMPYNSPYDDYMYVIDEFTGAGWWATDRNQIPGKVTIYIFKPSNARINYDIDNPNLENLARINSIKDTWSQDADYSDILSAIDNIESSSKSSNRPEFSFVITNGKVYHQYTDFKSSEASTLMKQYLQQESQLSSLQKSVSKMRVEYQQASDKSALSKDILQVENDLVVLRNDMANLANSIRRLELK